VILKSYCGSAPDSESIFRVASPKADLQVRIYARSSRMSTIDGAVALPSRQHRQQRIVPQIVMIVEVFVAQRNGEHPLADQRGHRMLHQILAVAIAKAGRKPIHQTDRTIESTPCSWICTGRNVAERERGARNRASRQRWQTVGVECTGVPHRGHRRAIDTPTSMDATRRTRLLNAARFLP
jgi:hypothetical protein